MFSPATVRTKNILLLSLDSPLFSKGAIHFGLGAESLAGYLQRELGLRVKHIDLQLDHDEALTEAIAFIEAERPEVVGVSTKIGSLDDLYTILDMLAELYRTSGHAMPMIVFGGVYATFAGRDVFRIAEERLGKDKRQNIVVVGRQGEYPLTRLVQTDFADIARVPNVLYYDARIDDLVDTGQQKVPLAFADVALPTSQTVSETLRRDGMIWAEFSRGCQSFCTFCSIKELRGSRDLEERAAEDVVRHFETLADLGVRSVAFADDDFPLSFDNAQRFADLMISTGLNRRVSFSMSTRSTNIIRPGDDDAERARKLRCFDRFVAAGLKDVFIGLESFSPAQLKRYGILTLGRSTQGEKKQAAANAEVVELLERSGVTLVAGFIPIDPLMADIEEFEYNLDMLKTSKMYRHVTNPLHVMRVQVGTAYEKLAQQAGLVSERNRVDLVFYDSEYINEIVEMLAQVCGNWNARKGSTDYALKTIRFSSFADRARFDEAQRIMEEIRLIDLDFGLALCSVAKETRTVPAEGGRTRVAPHVRQRFVADLAGVIAAFENRRKGLFDSMLKLGLVNDNAALADAIEADVRKLTDYIADLRENPNRALDDKAFLGKRDRRSVVESVIA